MLRRYSFKIYPNAAQELALREQARMCAQLYNALLEMRETHYSRAKQRGDKKTSLTAFDQGKDLTALNAAAKADPSLAEWRVMTRGTQERVADMLDLAFKAFFRRAKAGAGGQSGYPQYKGVYSITTYPRGFPTPCNVPMREPAKSCWKFEPKTADSTPARKSEPDSGGESSRALGEEGSVTLPGRKPSRSDPRALGDEGTNSAWRLTLRGVPGAIKARGRFPADPRSFKTADVKFYDGSWWFSVCVEMQERRVAGAEKMTVEFDLIDEFASVKLANGRCAPGLSELFLTGRESEPPKGKQEAGGSFGDPAFVGETQVCDVHKCRVERRGDPASVGADAIQSARDRRFKRGSIRWRREKRRIAHIKAHEARKTREALHRWTTEIVREASELAIIAPPIKDNTKSGRGNQQFPGAEVETIAKLNRSTLSQAPASAIAMLEYKAAEAGVVCATVRRDDHQLRIGRELRAVAIEGRKARRAVKRTMLEAAE